MVKEKWLFGMVGFLLGSISLFFIADRFFKQTKLDESVLHIAQIELLKLEVAELKAKLEHDQIASMARSSTQSEVDSSFENMHSKDVLVADVEPLRSQTVNDVFRDSAEDYVADQVAFQLEAERKVDLFTSALLEKIKANPEYDFNQDKKDQFDALPMDDNAYAKEESLKNVLGDDINDGLVHVECRGKSCSMQFFLNSAQESERLISQLSNRLISQAGQPFHNAVVYAGFDEQTGTSTFYVDTLDAQ